MPVNCRCIYLILFIYKHLNKIKFVENTERGYWIIDPVSNHPSSSPSARKYKINQAITESTKQLNTELII